MTPEGRMKEKVKKILREAGAYYHCPVMNGMGSPTLDFICCFRGRYLAIETKAPGKLPTERQRITMTQITDAGGAVLVISEIRHLDQLQDWLEKKTTWLNTAFSK